MDDPVVGLAWDAINAHDGDFGRSRGAMLASPPKSGRNSEKPSMIMLAGLLLSMIGTQTPESPPVAFPIFESVRPPRSVDVVAHRVGSGTVPEDTAHALEAAIADGLAWAEFAVRRTRDGQHILSGADRLEARTDGTGLVRDRTLVEVRSADAGSSFARRFAGDRLLTLEEGLHLARGRINLRLDVVDADATQFVREVLDAKMGHQVLIYGEKDFLRAAREAAGERIGRIARWRPGSDFARWVEEIRPHAVELDADSLDARAVTAFHGNGIRVEASAIGDDDRPAIWDRAADAGADWIRTDRPEEVLASRTLRRLGPRRTWIAYHRGAGRYAPENTLDSLRKAAAMGADFVEFDVRTTADGAFVLLHDGNLARTTTGRGSVRNRTGAEIATLDAGSWFGRDFAGVKVPTLDVFLEAAAPLGVGLYVDAKDIAPEPLVAALARYGVTHRAVVYQGADYLKKLRAIAPEIRRMPPLGDPSELDELAREVQPYAVDARWQVLSRPVIDRCHALGIKVFSDALGINENIGRYQQAVRDGLDLIQTDHPVRVLRALELLEDRASGLSGPDRSLRK